MTVTVLRVRKEFGWPDPRHRRAREVAFTLWNVDMRALKIAGAVVALLIVALAALLTIGIPASLITSAVQARIARDTGYHVTVAGAARLGLWPSLHVTVHDATIGDPKVREVRDRLTMERVQALRPRACCRAIRKSPN